MANSIRRIDVTEKEEGLRREDLKEDHRLLSKEHASSGGRGKR